MRCCWRDFADEDGIESKLGYLFRKLGYPGAELRYLLRKLGYLGQQKIIPLAYYFEFHTRLRAYN